MSNYARTKSFPVHKVGDDEFGEYEWEDVPDGLAWFVYAYTQGSYEGSGTAAFKTADGKYGSADLGHCSCYGPTERFDITSTTDLAGLLDDLATKPEDYDYKFQSAVRAKVMELEGVQP